MTNPLRFYLFVGRFVDAVTTEPLKHELKRSRQVRRAVEAHPEQPVYVSSSVRGARVAA